MKLGCAFFLFLRALLIGLTAGPRLMGVCRIAMFGDGWEGVYVDYPLSMQLEAFYAGYSYVTTLCGWFVEFETLERAISTVHIDLERCEQATCAINGGVCVITTAT